MDGIESKSIRFSLPAFADEFVGREAMKRLESFGEVIGSDEVAEVDTQLIVGVVVVALNRGLFDGAVHALDLTVRPGMIGFREAVVDAVQKTEPVKRMAAKAGRGSLAILRQIGELDAIVREHGMDSIGDSRDQRLEESRRRLHVGTFDQLHESELRSAVDGHKEIELAFGGAYLGQIDMEVADRIAFELLPSRLAASHLRKAADAMPLQTAMQRGAGQMRDRCLQSVEAIIEGQQSMPAEGNNDRLLFHRQDCGAAMRRPGTQISHRAALPPLRHGLRVDSMPPSQSPQALLTMLYRSTDRLCRRGAPV
jgi:hypothetical protein